MRVATGDTSSIKAHHATYFSGCSLRRLAPELNRTVFEWLKEKQYCLHQLVRCCSAFKYYSGDLAGFEKSACALLDQLVADGIELMIAACPNCFYRLGALAEQRGYDISFIALPTLLAEQGQMPAAQGLEHRKFVLHDSCPDRDEQIFSSSIKNLFKPFGVITSEEDDNTSFCCGAGQEFISLSFDEQVAQAEKRLAVLNGDVVPDIVLTGCASCTYALTAAESPSEVYHYLELVFDQGFSC